MGKYLPNIIAAIIGSLITVIFGFVMVRAEVINKKADLTYVDGRFEQNKVEQVRIENRIDQQFDVIMKFMDKQEAWLIRVEKKIDDK